MTENAKIGALVVTHGKLGHELLAAAEMIVGDLGWIEAISIGWHGDVNESKEAIEKGARSVDQGKGVLILTDMFGGTPSNLSLALLEKGRVEIVTGVNLPMIIKLAGQSGKESVSDLARTLKEHGQSRISIASELLGE
jgi:mannose PTS system EIIA component